MRELSRYSEAELLEELAKRCSDKIERKQVARWCHNCVHFKTWDDQRKTGPMPDNFNPCAKKHRMYFRMPDSYSEGEEYGFYRPVCKDRSEPEKIEKGDDE